MPPIRSATEIDYPPFCFVDSQGKASGFSIELLRAALAAMGRQVAFRSGPWAQVRGWLEQGEVDALPLVGRAPEREHLFDFTFPYMTLHGAIVVKKGTTDIHDINDLRGCSVAVMRGDNAEELLRRGSRGIEILTTATFLDALQMLSQGSCDAVVMQRLVALRLIQENNLADLHVVNQPVEAFRQDFCFGVKEGDRETLALLNEGLALVIADGTYQHLHAKWFAVLELPTHDRIVFGGNANYPPYEYLDAKGQPAGFNVDLTRAIAREMGLDIEIRLESRAEIREALARGEIDALEGMHYSPERDLVFDFSPPHAVNHFVAVGRKGGGPLPTTINELTGKRLVVQQGDIIDDLLKAKRLDPTLVTHVKDQEAALRELVRGKHDCALVSRLTALYFIKKYGWTNLSIGKKPLLTTGYCYAVAHHQKALLAQLVEGLKAVEENGEYRRIYEKWMGVYQEAPLRLTTILRYAALVIVPLLALLWVIFLWSWSLRKQVAIKTRELQRLSHFPEENPNPVLRCTLDGMILYTNAPARGWLATLGWQNDGPLPASVRTAVAEACGKNHSIVTEITSPDDRTLSISAVQPPGEKYVNLYGSDMTDRKAAQKALERSNQELEQFAYVASHDLQEPLRAVVGFLQLLQSRYEHQIDEKGRHFIDRSVKAGHRMQTLIRDLLTLSRVSSKAAAFAPTDLNHLVDNVRDNLRAVIQERNARIDCSPLPTLIIDAGQIQSLFQNLIVNAVKYNESPQPRIEIGCRENGNTYVFFVKDNGIGIASAFYQRIFMVFQRLHTEQEYPGTGVGLALCKKIVERHGGTIWVESRPREGSTFYFTLPRNK